MSQDGGVIPGAGADVEDLLRAGQFQELAHACDHDRLRDGLPGADRQRGVLPREPGEGLRDEQMPGHGSNRRHHPFVPNVRPNVLYEALSRGL
jgi:hypothetical protein